MGQPTFAGRQLPTQIKSFYRPTNLLSEVDAIIAENGNESNSDQPTLTVEFKNETQDRWEWSVTDQRTGWKSWVRTATGVPITD